MKLHIDGIAWLLNAGNKVNGPGQVLTNLTKGLDKINYPYYCLPQMTSNKPELLERGELGLRNYMCMLQPMQVPDSLKIDLLGPNIFVLPREFDRFPQGKKILENTKHFVVPSQWVKDKYNELDKDIIAGRPIHIWPVGIDTDHWKPSQTKDFNKQVEELHCLVYFKSRSKTQELNLICDALYYNRIKFTVIEYGKYTPEVFKQSCDFADFAILLDNTESQGIAVMEMMSMNLPMLVFDKKEWVYEHDQNIRWPSTSVPYFDKRCGMISEFNVRIAKLQTDIKDFVDACKSGEYNPREYMLENHTLELGAKKFIDIIENIR